MIAGGGGFLGSATARTLLSRGWKVVTLGLGAPPRSKWTDTPRLSHVEGLLERQLFSKAANDHGRPDVVIHAGGGASVGRSWEDPRGDFNLSVGSTVEILDFIRSESPDSRLVLVSSAAVYGNSGLPRLSETDSCAPVSPYGLHKHVCEQLAIGEARMRELDVSIIRFFSIYGENLRKQILWDIMSRVNADPDAPLELWGDGDETRDFLHVDDAARILTRLAETSGGGKVRVYNGGSGQAISVRDLAANLIKAAGRHAELTFNGKARSGDPRHLVANAEYLIGDLGFVPMVSMSEGLKRYADWYRQLHD